MPDQQRIFFTDELEGNIPLSDAVATVVAEVRSQVQEVIDRTGADEVVIDQDGDGGLIQNWRDILAV